MDHTQQFEVEETTCDKADVVQQHRAKLAESQRQLAESKRALDDALQSQIDTANKASTLEQEKNALTKQLQVKRDGSENELTALQAQLSQLQSANASLTNQIAEERVDAAKNRQLNSKEVSDLRSMLRARDDTIRGLQGQAEQGQKRITELEAELKGLQVEKRSLEEGKEREQEERQDEVGNLMRENEELMRENKELNRVLEDQGRELGQMRDQLQEGESQKEATLARQDSSRERATMLEVELQKANEKADELSSALNESMEEIEDLQADVVFKEGKISSLEGEIEEASRLLEEAQAAANDEEESRSSPRSSTASFARLRQEIERVTRERVQLESDHSLEVSLLRTSKDCEISKLTKECEQLKAEAGEVATLKRSLAEVEAAKAKLSDELEKTREIMDMLDAEEDRELEESKAKADELQTANAELQFEIDDLRVMLENKERELTRKDEATEGELWEARRALIALDDKRRDLGRDLQGDEGNVRAGEVKVLNEQLSAVKEKFRESEARLMRATRENELTISDLQTELFAKEEYAKELRAELESLQLSVERGPSQRNYGMSIDPEWQEPNTVSKLKVQVSNLTREKSMLEKELRGKIESRDATIATLVLSSSNQEASVGKLTSEVSRLQALLDEKSSSQSVSSERSRELEASQRRELERLRNETHDLSLDLKQTKRRLMSATEELECARSQLEATMGAVPDAQDLAGRLVISEQAQKMLKAENVEKLKERDAAIANLLQSVQANEGIIANLRADVDGFKSKLAESVEENRRLKHESEIFAAQIIDQDEEFEGLNTRLKEKSSEVASLRREIASSSAEVRNAKKLEQQLVELNEENNRNLIRINNLEVKLRDADLKNAGVDGFQVERLKLELKNTVADKEATEERLNKQIDSLRKLRNHAVEDFEAKLRDRAGQIASLENELLELREKVLDEDFDDIFLDEKPGSLKNQLIEERNQLLSKNEALVKEVETLRASASSAQLLELRDKLARLEKQREKLEKSGPILNTQQVSELKSKLAQSEQFREQLEKDLSQINSSKDKEMDHLHKQLSDAREAQSIREQEQLSTLKRLESENSKTQEEFRVRMKEKNAKIVALEQTLAAQEQVVGNMSNEMDQLQNGMEKVSVQRRAEIEEISQELMDYTSRATRLERECMALSMKLDEKKLKHRADVAKLKDRIATLESETPIERSLRHDAKNNDSKRESELTEKNDHLKWINNTLKDENEKLKGKVEQLKKANNNKKKEDKDSAPKSAKNNDKWRNVALQEQVAVLSQRVIELEEAAAAAPPTQGRPPQTPRSSIVHSPVIRSSIEIGSGNRSSSTPKSALRVSTYNHSNSPNRDPFLNNDKPEVEGDNLMPPALPRGGGTPISSKGKSKGSRSSSRFSLRKKSKDRLPSSPKFDDASGSTANYHF